MSLADLSRAPVAAFCIDENGRIIDVNAAFEFHSEQARDALVGRRLDDVLLRSDVGDRASNTHLSEDLNPPTKSPAGAIQPEPRTLGVGPRAGLKLRTAIWRSGAKTFGLAEPLGVHEDAAAALTEFAVVIAHEIRNPLAGIGSALEVISDRLPPGGPEREVIGEIRGRLHRLNHQVDDLLLLVRPIHPRPQSCALEALVAAAYRQTGLTEPPLGPSVSLRADDRLLETALVRVLRYAGHGPPPVCVEWTTTEDRVTLSVSGGRFAAPSRAQNHQPAVLPQDGLELPVARRIAEAHGGHLKLVLSPPGVELRLELPIG